MKIVIEKASDYLLELYGNFMLSMQGKKIFDKRAMLHIDKATAFYLLLQLHSRDAFEDALNMFLLDKHPRFIPIEKTKSEVCMAWDIDEEIEDENENT